MFIFSYKYTKSGFKIQKKVWGLGHVVWGVGYEGRFEFLISACPKFLSSSTMNIFKLPLIFLVRRY